MDKDTTKLTLTEYLKPLNHKFFSDHIHNHCLDRYVKKLNTMKLTKLFVFAQLKHITSYSDLSAHLKRKKKLQHVVGLPSISTSQLSRKWRDLDSSYMAEAFRHMVQRVVTEFGIVKSNQKLGVLNLIDASTISLCLTKYRWATLSKHKSGVKLHLRFVHTSESISYPEEVTITEAKRNERTEMDSIIVDEPDALNVFDRGYVDYQKYDHYCENGVRFVTRLRHNADYQIVKELRVDADSKFVKDSVIWLGYRNTRYIMKRHLRLVECLDKDGKTFTILTNDFNLSATEIGDIYRNRWQIELFFKWIKQHLHIKSCYGTSRNAVHNQIYAALITFCLTLLMQSRIRYKGSLLDVMKHLTLSWEETLQDFISGIFRPPEKKSTGRVKGIDVERIYQEIMHAYNMDGIDYLDDMTIGSMI